MFGKRYFVVDCYERDPVTYECVRIHTRIHRGSAAGLSALWEEWNEAHEVDRLDQIVCECSSMEAAVDALALHVCGDLRSLSRKRRVKK